MERLARAPVPTRHEAEDLRQTSPTVLVTGFSVFPGVSANPTEALIADLAATCYRPHGVASIDFAVLAVDYAALPGRIAALQGEAGVDVAIHFGLSARAGGFMLEQVARNRVGDARPDICGFSPPAGWLGDGPAELRSTLPLDEIHEALVAEGLSVSFSQNAGDYVCNALFYKTLLRPRQDGRPSMAGFIHVPHIRPEDGRVKDLTFSALRAGAVIVIETCVRVWLRDRLAQPPVSA